MGLVANIQRDMRFAKGLRRLLKRIKPIDLDSPDLVCDDWEEAVDKFPDHVAIQDDRVALTYRERDAMANRFSITNAMVSPRFSRRLWAQWPKRLAMASSSR